MAISCFSFPYLSWGENECTCVKLMKSVVRSIAQTRDQPHKWYLTPWRAAGPSMDWWRVSNNWKRKRKRMKINRYRSPGFEVSHWCTSVLWVRFQRILSRRESRLLTRVWDVRRKKLLFFYWLNDNCVRIATVQHEIESCRDELLFQTYIF